MQPLKGYFTFLTSSVEGPTLLACGSSKCQWQPLTYRWAQLLMLWLVPYRDLHASNQSHLTPWSLPLAPTVAAELREEPGWKSQTHITHLPVLKHAAWSMGVAGIGASRGGSRSSRVHRRASVGAISLCKTGIGVGCQEGREVNTNLVTEESGIPQL